MKTYVNESDQELKNEIIEGRNAVIEALRAERSIDKIYINKGDVDKTLGHIASKARDKGIVVVECDRRKLDFMSVTNAHQGVIAVCAVRDYCSIDDILSLADFRGEPPLLLYAMRSAIITISVPLSEAQNVREHTG